nr:hypothetical protein [Tanacetum cinerariifolium]
MFNNVVSRSNVQYAHQEFETGFTEDHPIDETTQLLDWFQKPSKHQLPTMIGTRLFLLFMDQFNLGSTLWLGKKILPLPLIPNSRGRRIIPFDHFINNDLAYLSGGVSSRTYTTSVMKTKDADYGHIKWIEDLLPNTMWSQVLIVYDKHAHKGISHSRRKRQQFYGYAVNRECDREDYSRNKIIGIKKLEIVEWHNYKHLDWITVRRDDDKLYTFKEGDYNILRLQDIEDILLLLVQGKVTNLNIKERLALGVSLEALSLKGVRKIFSWA